ncbi:MAG UNVERIFIED_CONTAM: hypothetical protein LVR29_16835 [Microcystis novacekii LVE1205-3]
MIVSLVPCPKSHGERQFLLRIRKSNSSHLRPSKTYSMKNLGHVYRNLSVPQLVERRSNVMKAF